MEKNICQGNVLKGKPSDNGALVASYVEKSTGYGNAPKGKHLRRLLPNSKLRKWKKRKKMKRKKMKKRSKS